MSTEQKVEYLWEAAMAFVVAVVLFGVVIALEEIFGLGLEQWVNGL